MIVYSIMFYYTSNKIYFIIVLLNIVFIVLFQSLSCGMIIANYGPIIFNEVGASEKRSIEYNIIVGIIRVFVTAVTASRIDSLEWGRRQLLLHGLFINFIGLIMLSACLYITNNNNFNINIPLFFVLPSISIIVMGYSMSFGVVSTLLQSEMFPTYIKSKILMATSIIQYLLVFVINYLFLPYLHHYGQRIFGIFTVCTFFGFVFVYFFVVETIGKLPSEILKELNQNDLNVEKKQSITSFTSENDKLLGLSRNNTSNSNDFTKYMIH